MFPLICSTTDLYIKPQKDHTPGQIRKYPYILKINTNAADIYVLHGQRQQKRHGLLVNLIPFTPHCTVNVDFVTFEYVSIYGNLGI
jgi:hypothetical protein